MFYKIKKRDGTIVEFDSLKITSAITKDRKVTDKEETSWAAGSQRKSLYTRK
jgi:anaerobic ribonucleoside-triphosphate reductase